VLLHPRDIFVAVGRIHYDQIAFRGNPINNQVVHHAAILVTHHTVADLPVIHIGKIIGQQVVQVRQRIPALIDHLTHVGNIEQPCFGADRHMLLDHACAVLYRQQISRKRDNLAATCGVAVIEWCFQFQLASLFPFRFCCAI